jgi:hypothetical protein
VSDEDDGLPLGVEASINEDAFDPEDLDDEELCEHVRAVSPASVASSAFYSTVREVSCYWLVASMFVLEYYAPCSVLKHN